MPTTAAIQYSGGRLDPLFNADDALASMIKVQLKASTTFAAGTVLGEVSATPGTYGPYASGNTDGTQTPAVILAYPVTTDASGTITNASEWPGVVETTVPCYTQGTFRCQDLTGLDANAVTKMAGRLTEGTVASGIFTF